MKLLISDVFRSVFAVIDLKHATLKIKDNGANSVTVKIGEGNLSYSEKKPRQYIKDRGVLSEVRDGDEEPMDVSFDFIWEYITATNGTGTPPATVEDALKKIGPAAAWVSTDSDLCRPYAVDLVIEYVPTAGCGDKETITLPDFRYEQLDHDLSAGRVSCSGKCNVTSASPVRADNPTTTTTTTAA